MSGREKRNVSKPGSYKEFDKSGRDMDKDKESNTGQSELEIFAPTEDPDLGLESKLKKRNKSRKDRVEEEESSELGPDIPEKELAIEREIQSRKRDDNVTKELTKNGESHDAGADIRVDAVMHDQDNEQALGAGALGMSALQSVGALGTNALQGEPERKKPAKTPRKAKAKKNMVSTAEFAKILASGTTMSMMSDEQLARLSEEQFNQILNQEQDMQEQLARDRTVRARRHQQKLLHEKRLKEEAENRLQEQRFQQEMAEIQQARQRAEAEMLQPLTDHRSVQRFEYERQDNNVSADRFPGAFSVPSDSPSKFRFTTQTGNTKFRGVKAPASSTAVRPTEQPLITACDASEFAEAQNAEEHQNINTRRLQLTESAKQLADDSNLFDCSITGVKALQQHGLWLDDQTRTHLPPNRDIQMNKDRARSRVRTTPPYGLSKGRQTVIENQAADKSGESKEEKIKSGITEKAEASVRQKLTWPQKNLGFKFIQEPLGFNQLTFEHLIVGEITTIRNCQSMVEAKHRMRLLERIGYWRLRGADWSQIRAFYAAILAGIEAEEFAWDVSFADIESMIIDKPLVAAAVKPDKKPNQRVAKKTEGIWFCKDYNSEMGCELDPGHNVTTPQGDMKAAQHICAKCWRFKKQKREHAETSTDCPFKNQ